METKKVKVGHCGTLDPLAEGVLVLALGPAVRLVPYVQQQSKRYRGRFLLGQSSPTGDLEMDVTRHDDLRVPSRDELAQQACTMIGQIQQTPPAYSAIWVDGKRAYDRVRGGEDVTVPSRTVSIESIEILDYEFPELELDIVCGSGTYIRTLGMDLAEGVGSRAVMSYLQRVSIGEFDIASSVSIDQLREDDLQPMLCPAELAIRHLPNLAIDDEASQRIGHGLCLDDESTTEVIGELLGKVPGDMISDAATDQHVAAMTAEGSLRAILRLKNGQWCPYRVF